MSELNFQPVELITHYNLGPIEEVDEEDYGCDCGMSFSECTCWSSTQPDVSNYCFGCGMENDACTCDQIPKMFAPEFDDDTVSYYTENSNIAELEDGPEIWAVEPNEEEVVQTAGMPECAE